MKPKARELDLLVRQVEDDVVVCDLTRHRTICLNATTAMVWRACDGRRTVEGIAEIVGKRAGIPIVDPLLVWIALDKLSKEGLLVDPVAPPPEAANPARRAMLRKMLVTGGLSLALPAISSILLPTPAYAVTCIPAGGGCPCGACCDKGGGSIGACKDVITGSATSCPNGTTCGGKGGTPCQTQTCTPCASPGTLISTPEGERPISDLLPGDLVYSVHNDEITAVPLIRVARSRIVNHRVVRVSLNGRQLEISGGHPTADGRTFSDLRRGDLLDGHQITDIETVRYGHEYTFDILPDSSTMTYFAEGALIGTTLRRD